MSTRDTCIFHRKFFDEAKKLNPTERVYFYEAIFDYCLKGINDFDESKQSLKTIKTIIDSDIKNREEKLRGETCPE